MGRPAGLGDLEGGPDPGPGEVQVRVQACGVGPTVTNNLRGENRDEPSMLPRVPGHEPVGRVVAPGPGVDIEVDTRREAGGRAGVYPGLYDDPHRRSLTAGTNSSSRLASIPLPSRPAENPTAAAGSGWCARSAALTVRARR